MGVKLSVVLVLFIPLGAMPVNAGVRQITPQVQKHFEAAERAAAQGDYPAAEREYREVINLSPRFAEAYMNLGLVYQLQRRIPEAVGMFEEALKIKPTLAGANFFLGMDYCQRGEARRAAPFLRAAVHAKPDQPEIWAWLATADDAAGDVTAEIRTLLGGLHLHPNNLDMLYLLGHAYESLGRQAIDRLRKLRPNSSYVDQLLAEDYMNTGYLAAALVHLQNALAAAPKRPDLYVEEAEIYLRAGRLKLAAEEIDEALAFDPHDLRALVYRGEVRLFDGNIEGALADWSRALKTDMPRTYATLGIEPQDVPGLGLQPLPASLRNKIGSLQAQLEKRDGAGARLAMVFLNFRAAEPDFSGNGLSPGFTHRQQSDAPAACNAQLFNMWLEEDNLEAVARCGSRVLTSRSPAELRLQLARACFLTRRPAQAIGELNELPASVRDSGPALYWRVRAYKALALEAYQKLYSISSDSYRVHELQGDIYEAQGQDNKAVDEYKKALSEKPDLPNLHYEVGHLLWKNLQLEPAERELHAELALNPRHAGALLDLGTIFLYQHEPRKALPCLRKSEAIDPSNPDVHHFLGLAYMRAGDYKQAEAEFERVAPEDRSGEIHYLLARVYEALGKRQEAAHEFTVSNQLNRESHGANEKRVKRLSLADALLKRP